MNFLKKTVGVRLGLACLGTLFTGSAMAAMVLGYQEIGTGTVTGSGTVNAMTVRGSAFYGDTFGAPTTTITASPGWGFYDDVIFSVPVGATTDSVTSTIAAGTLWIDNLEVRLYNEAANSPLPVLGTPAGGAISCWSTPLSPPASGSVSVLDTTLRPGTYVLEIRGDVNGASGGSYSGSLDVNPVPLPAALPLLLSGLGALGGLARRRAVR